MSVRAKLILNPPNHGARGVELSFYAVYEGNAELQQITENAIFGNATPSATLSLVGDYMPNQIKGNEEYFVDLTDRAAPSGWIILGQYEERFRSAFNPNYPEGPTRYRYDITSEGPWRGSFDLSVQNPDAIVWMDEHKTGKFAVRLARGQRSDEEIALREQALKDTEERVRENFRRRYRLNSTGGTETEDEHVAHYTAADRRKLAIARGEVVD